MVQYVQRRESKKAAGRNVGTAESHDENSRTKGRKEGSAERHILKLGKT